MVVLDREVESTKQIYQSLLQRAKETGVSGELKTSNIRVVDKAEKPRGPVSPRKQINLLLGFLGGGMLAFGLAFFFEYMDSRIKTPDEIRVHLRLSHLGLLPITDTKSGYPLLSDPVPAIFSEAFRGVRTNVLFSSAQEGARSVVVTSTGPVPKSTRRVFHAGGTCTMRPFFRTAPDPLPSPNPSSAVIAVPRDSPPDP